MEVDKRYLVYPKWRRHRRAKLIRYFHISLCSNSRFGRQGEGGACPLCFPPPPPPLTVGKRRRTSPLVTRRGAPPACGMALNGKGGVPNLVTTGGETATPCQGGNPSPPVSKPGSSPPCAKVGGPRPRDKGSRSPNLWQGRGVPYLVATGEPPPSVVTPPLFVTKGRRILRTRVFVPVEDWIGKICSVPCIADILVTLVRYK